MKPKCVNGKLHWKMNILQSLKLISNCHFTASILLARVYVDQNSHLIHAFLRCIAYCIAPASEKLIVKLNWRREGIDEKGALSAV